MITKLKTNYDIGFHKINLIIRKDLISCFKLGLINVRKGENKSTNFCDSFYEKFKKKYDIIYEDREIRVGEKLNVFDLIGIPIQIIIGEKNLINDNVEIKDRKTGKISIINKEQIEIFLKKEYEF